MLIQNNKVTLQDYDHKYDTHTAPLFTTVCLDERHVRGYENSSVMSITTELISL
jgi:hypothetical protein